MATILQVRPPSDPSSSEPSSTEVVVGESLVGRKIGSYTILRELGQGGMGCVYLAEHSLIGRKAAIKVLNPDIATDPEVVSRFFTEARAVNDIRHPNIVEVTDFGQHGSLYCIVMEFLEGDTLAARLQRVRTFDETAVVSIMKQCTSALGAAHEQGLVHRDIKPENIFLRNHPDYPDFVKLLDFGIAKLLGPESSVGHHTKTGSVLGTPSYMSPEQCLGEATLDIRSDVYSLGVVIYQMLTGLLPFVGDTLGRLIVCHVSEAPVPPSVINPGVSRAMNDLVLRAMQKRPKDRYQSAREMREALERVLAPHARVATPIFGVKTHAAPAAPARPAPARAAGDAPVNPTAIVARGWSPGPPAPGSGAAGDARPAAAPSLPAATAGPSGAGDLGRRLVNIVLDRIAGGQVDMPDLPGATIRCLELARVGRLGFAEAAHFIGEVPSLRSRIMKLANSAAFPSLMPATTLELAVARLGSQGLQTALVEFSAREALEGRHPRVKEAMRRIWPHALGTAVMTREIATSLGNDPDAAEHGYLSGVLREVGRPVVAGLLLEIEQQMQRAGNRAPISEAVFLAAVEGAAHMAAGAVARHWDLPAEIPSLLEQCREWDTTQPRTLSNIVRFAAAATCRLGLTFGFCNGAEVERLYGEGQALLKVSDTVLKRSGHGFRERINVLAGIRG